MRCHYSPPQVVGVDEVAVVNTTGCVIVVEAVTVHAFLSVTVTVYVPTERPVAVAFVCPVGVHK